mgnify:CR=1 FL=1
MPRPDPGGLLLQRYPQLLTARYGFKTEGLDGFGVIEGVAQKRAFRVRGGVRGGKGS